MTPSITTFIVFSLALFASACSKPASSSSAPDTGGALTHVKLALNWVPEPEFGGFYTARESGAFTRHGLEVEIMGGGAGVPVMQMVATGRADFGTVGGDELVSARVRGADLVAVFATFQTSPQGIMVHASRKIDALRDAFHSGTMAIEPGLAYAAYLKKQFPWDGVQIVPYDGGIARFLSDENFGQQCYVTSEPIAARRKGIDPRVFLIAETGFNPYATVIVTSRRMLADKPEVVRGFVTAAQEGWRDYLADPSPTHQLLGRLNPSMDGATLTLAAEAQKPLIETEETRARGLGTMSTERWSTLAKQLLDLGFIDRAPAAEDLAAAVR